jgi:hypothetical protein
MKNLFKSIVSIGLLAIATLTMEAQQVLTFTTPATNGVVLVSTNRASVYQVEVTSTASGLLSFYDANQITVPIYGTNYTNAVYTTRTSYPTNYVTSFVGYNGFTNWYTNAGIWTLVSTNAANTNALSPLFSVPVVANTLAVVNVDALFVRGITCLSTATNSGVVLSYRSGQ